MEEGGGKPQHRFTGLGVFYYEPALQGCVELGAGLKWGGPSAPWLSGLQGKGNTAPGLQEPAVC